MTAIALTIAGSDSGGGAGIQADLKTFSALGVYGTSVLTAVTAQNTRGVTAIETLSPEIVRAQIDAVLSDIDVKAIKIGMVGGVETIEAIAGALKDWGRRVVLDPVMVATSGDRLLEPEAIEALREQLLPRAMVLTPNLPEAALLTGQPIADNEMQAARQADKLLSLGASAVLVKGGHAKGDLCTDLLFDGVTMLRFESVRIKTTHDHGTGCTLAAAITAGMALGLEPGTAVAAAKEYLTAAISAAGALKVGQGRGPVHHFHRWWLA
ncbi:bifunctional hydroxymethylpyrimidine kinase/phosphomethylpyrimidine kinase [Phyllobacterium endophyticum]|uniref:hydroxymethylpyrimidine kinase n=1 Tax=Phyllobacterium endophyticum TaxID=1149773 RepID=A0A2P7B078_9HYPH|nr:bifunctional hydroxymethylpyrimidine kinase/phosphomethylpyrimidine kinase [Phyllobacterium endophyticum]MBB3235500.1 hydroxymethylpyrimidine/phosphomethylpyrimidine kinase [Phyllobacterium endophyticum]PSH59859.1 bifunctional hydroxymethylpyrimidine kinase/phosphomethylpyrimidine kinase [Phyllobacterium endophyticum]TYR42007.1 bifunctional hydroxymethylpyrimidine kinase/phosphomethylpyrimidine kinase [Phyllobacterium endophyticum]